MKAKLIGGPAAGRVVSVNNEMDFLYVTIQEEKNKHGDFLTFSEGVDFPNMNPIKKEVYCRTEWRFPCTNNQYAIYMHESFAHSEEEIFLELFSGYGVVMQKQRCETHPYQAYYEKTIDKLENQVESLKKEIGRLLFEKVT